MTGNKSIAKSAGVLGFATTCSRVLGFIRDVIIAKLFGTGIFADAFVVAWRIPNLLRDLVAEGATNAAFVPVLSEYDTRYGRDAFWKLAAVILNIILVVLAVLTILGVIFAPWIVRLIAPGFLSDPQKLNVTTQLTRVLFPYLIIIGLSAYGMGVLNTLRHFSTPAFGQAILNLMIIVSAMFFGENVFGLTFGVLIGGLLQLLIQVPPLLRAGFRFEKKFNFRHPAVKKIGLLLIPRALGGCVYQVNVFVSTILASFSSIVGAGAPSALYYSYRLMLLPLGIFGVSISQAALPAMSVHFTKGEVDKLKDAVIFSLKAVSIVVIPAAAGLMSLSHPIIRVLLERGKFSDYSTQITANALFFYALGLTFFSLTKILANAFYAMQDTFSPVKAGFCSLLVNIPLNLILMFPLKISGLALADSLAGALNCFLLYTILTRRIGSLANRSLVLFISKVLFSSVLMAILCRFTWTHLASIGKIPALAISLIAGIAAYLCLCLILRVNELKDLIKWLFRIK